MSLYYQDDYVTLYHGDCLTEHREWLDADVLVTDPPYGIDWAIGHERNGRRASVPISGDLDLVARDTVLELWGARKAAVVFGSALKPAPAGTKQVLVWEKTMDSGVLGTVAGFRRNWEAIYLRGNLGKRPATKSSVITSKQSTTRNAIDAGHPHSKPLSVMQILIGSTPPGVITDPFAGSGSTLVAAKALGRKVIGVELEERYCETIAKRCAQEVLDIFGGAA
jgi:site-specific DNA-methyltransferase (adenine-specific)